MVDPVPHNCHWTKKWLRTYFYEEIVGCRGLWDCSESHTVSSTSTGQSCVRSLVHAIRGKCWVVTKQGWSSVVAEKMSSQHWRWFSTNFLRLLLQVDISLLIFLDESSMSWCSVMEARSKISCAAYAHNFEPTYLHLVSWWKWGLGQAGRCCHAW